MSYLRFLLVALLLAPMMMQAQSPSQSSSLSYNDVVYKKEFNIGIQAHTNGLGINAHFVKIHNIFKKTIYEIELMDIKHPKEFRNQSIFASSQNTARGYVYAKQNNFYNLNFTIGKMKMLAEKGRKSGVDIGLYYAGGLSLGLAKPYYLELFYRENDTVFRSDEKYTEGFEPNGNSDVFLNPGRIYGASGFSFGLNEMKVYPGAKAKVSLVFDWASYKEFVKAIEVGAMANVYFARVPILVPLKEGETYRAPTNVGTIPVDLEQDVDHNKFLFFNLYVKFLFGKRW